MHSSECGVHFLAFLLAWLVVVVAPHAVSDSTGLDSRRSQSDGDAIYFPGGDFPRGTQQSGQLADNNAIEASEIPLDLIMRLNEVQNITELFRDFVKVNPVTFGLDSEDTLNNRFGDVERKSATMPKPATCMPELRTVTLSNELNADPTLFYYPSCTRVERCGGCCSHNLLSCQPTLTEMINYQVIVTQYTGANQLRFVGKEIVPVEQHLKCKCDCITKKKDCNEFQEYRDKECRCVCVNFDDEMKCDTENETKLWDSKSCTCGCRELKECSTGYYHDEKTCSCLPVPITRRRVSDGFVGQYDNRRRDQVGRFDYKLLPAKVVPLQKSNDSKSWSYLD